MRESGAAKLIGNITIPEPNRTWLPAILTLPYGELVEPRTIALPPICGRKVKTCPPVYSAA
jgi:hypothetical protein